jgi:hypothetical protein
MLTQVAAPVTLLSLAIDAHKAAKALWYAQPEAARNADHDPAFDALLDAERDLVSTPAANDAEFVRKLHYLHGEAGGDFSSVLAALGFHFSATA